MFVKLLSEIGEKGEFEQNPSNMNCNWNFFSGPTPSQLAARQAILRDLPVFNGDPSKIAPS